MNEIEKKAVKEIEKSLKTWRPTPGQNGCVENHRKYYGLLRDACHLFEDVVNRLNQSGSELKSSEGKSLRNIVREAVMTLGGIAEPSPISLKDYDHLRFGPYLGVSDDGSSAHIIRKAAFASPKCKVIGCTSSMEVGVAHDAERLAAVGEVAVGPEEYRDIILECHGSILMSTNIGTRLNLRYYKIRPSFHIVDGPISEVIDEAIERAKELIHPFLHTPDGIPRPTTIFVTFNQGKPLAHRLPILKALNDAFTRGEFCNTKHHKLGLLVTFSLGSHGLERARDSIKLAHDAGLTEVAIQGPIRGAAQNKISMPGLLNFFSPTTVRLVQSYAAKMKVRITPKNLVDPDTVARNVWSGLLVARNMGLQLGKYGLFPLTLDEADEVMGQLQGIFGNWTAAPVFYIDFPHLLGNKVFSGKDIQKGAEAFLDIVGENKVPVVLIDTADKDKGRKLLKQNLKDRLGIFTLEQVSDLDRYAREKGVKVLWAGGISLPQAFELGKLKVFGIYVTTAAAAIRPVTVKYERDPMMTAEREITFAGVSRAKLLLETGFLVASLHEKSLAPEAEALGNTARKLMRLLDRAGDNESQGRVQDELVKLTTAAWKVHLNISE